jgi:hypothetical protein
LDALTQRIRADVILSTCVLHHPPEQVVPTLLANLCAPLLMFTGPNAETHAPYGDHAWHLEADKLQVWLSDLGYEVTFEPIGLTAPFCELFVVARQTMSEEGR